MSTWIITTRNPQSKRLIIIQQGRAEGDPDNDFVAEYPTEHAADLEAMEIPACKAWGWDAVEVP